MIRSSSRVQPELQELAFPVLLAASKWIRVYSEPRAMTSAWKKAVDQDNFARAILVDSNGRARRVKNVHVVSSIGPFFGFDLFLNRSMRIEYDFEGEWEQADLKTLRARAKQQWLRASSSFDPDFAAEFERKLDGASDFRKLIAVLASQFSGQFERTS